MNKIIINNIGEHITIELDSINNTINISNQNTIILKYLN